MWRLSQRGSHESGRPRQPPLYPFFSPFVLSLTTAGQRAGRTPTGEEGVGGRERAADESCSERAGGGAELRRQASERSSDGELLRSLHRLARDLSAVDPPAPFLRALFASISRRSKLLAAALDDLRGAAEELPQPAGWGTNISMVSPSLQEGDRSTRQEIVSVAMARLSNTIVACVQFFLFAGPNEAMTVLYPPCHSVLQVMML
ncbi:uncharacterized protein LOC127786069 isoform X2 [Oryza glaberrima]|uniref:uncharacterized protein LOC127786069 isoform X2 n=1 Tax=Oryza glaberrima TaxID=4538 RepID=UPI00224C008B|nr:uncharacterized protein LOC127786069 isoform X2 [Oryza glaberrima]